MSNKKKKLIGYAVSGGISALITVLITLYQLNSFDKWEPLRAVSDGFFVPGVFFCGLGAMVLISGTGFFDIFSYAFKSLTRLFTPLRGMQLSYAEYKELKESQEKKPPASILVVGAVDIALAVVFYLLYNMG